MKYQVNEFEIDTTLFRFSKNNQALAIEPKVFDLIVYLMVNQDRVVSRDELFQELWQGREVSDTSLSNHIKIARKLFDDNGERQAIIKTVRGRGYQFIGSIISNGALDSGLNAIQDEAKTPLASKNSVALNAPHQVRETRLSNSLENKGLKGRINRAKQLNSKSGLFIVLIVVIILFTILWQIFIHDRAKSNPLDKQVSQQRPYILVLPFEVSGTDTQKWQPFADQITRETIVKLRQISGLRVVPSASAFTFRKNKTHQYIKEQIPEIEYVLTGTVNIEIAPNLRISGELSSLARDEVIWNDNYQTQIDSTNFFQAQTELAAAVSKSLKVAILDKEAARIGEHHTSNIAAYEYFVAGQQQLNLLTHESLYEAIKLYDNALALDPNFEEAIVAKANAYRIIMSYYEQPRQVLPKVVETVLSALKVNPQSAEAYSSLGLAYVFAWRWQDAWQMLNSAKQLDPNIALTELGFALYYSGLGEPKKVKQALFRANQLDPLNIELADWGHWALAMTGENDAAIEWANNKMQLHPDVGIIYSGASVSASLNGQHQRAIELAKKGIELDSGGTYPQLALAQAYGYANQPNRVLPLIDNVEQDTRYVCPYETAVAYILIEQQEKAFELLNQAVKFRSNCLVFTRNDPRLQPIKNSSNFKALLTRVGLDDDSVKRYKR